MSTDRSKTYFWIIWIGLHVFFFYNFFNLGRDVLLGDGSAFNMWPQPRYEYMRLPLEPYINDSFGVGRFAVDFAQIYFPGQNYGLMSENYKEGLMDPFFRPSRYPPLLHWLCGNTLSRVSYGHAALFHLLFQYLLFLGSIFFAFRKLGISKWLPVGILVINFCLFFTPVGLSHFERGQYTLYVALSYLWMTLAFHFRNPFYLGIAAVFGFIKWTALPFLFVAHAVWILSSKTLTEFKSRLILALVFPAVFGSLFLFDIELGIKFLKSAIHQEENMVPMALSLGRLIPIEFVKLLPLTLISIGIFRVRRENASFLHSAPFLVGCSILMITYPTIAFDYAIPTTLGLVPVFIWWLSKKPFENPSSKGLVIGLTLIFLVCASFAFLQPDWQTPLAHIVAYGIVGILLVFYPLSDKKDQTDA